MIQGRQTFWNTKMIQDKTLIILFHEDAKRKKDETQKKLFSQFESTTSTTSVKEEKFRT